MTTWSDLPVEVVDDILDLCDNPTLLSLARLNCQLNNHALHVFFKREGVYSMGDGFCISHSTPYLFIPAFDLILWKSHLPQLVYHFHSDPQLLFHQVAGIIRLLNRVSVTDQLGLNLERIDDYCSVRKQVARSIDSDAWERVFITLLETALRKGCRDLYLCGGDHLEMLYHNHTTLLGLPLAPRKPFGQRFSGWFGGCLGWNRPKRLPVIQPPQVTSFTTLSPSLIFLNLRSSMMLQPLFLSHTLSLVHNHSSVLRKLKLVGVKAPVFIWEHFLASLSLPVLDEFVYRQDERLIQNPVVTTKLILEFFIRHSTIRKVKLYGVRMEEFPGFEPTMLLPNLVALDAHPRIVSWLLQHPNVFPDLVYVSLTSELCYATSLPPYAAFNAGLLSSKLTCAPSPSSVDHTTSTKPIRLQFKFNVGRGLFSWLQTHTINPSQSPLQCLENIESISISTMCYIRLDMPCLEILPTFLGLYPSLRWLRFHKLWDREESKATLGSEEFVKALKMKCPLLQGCVVDGVWVFGEKEFYGREDFLFGYEHALG